FRGLNLRESISGYRRKNAAHYRNAFLNVSSNDCTGLKHKLLKACGSALDSLDCRPYRHHLMPQTDIPSKEIQEQ
ncbi:MAG TPA: hypothetical protein VEF04_13415, partial [Blastocatellia bacterium]|nr:hypothetical protein [Blastocatellia bacterium]